MIRRAFWLTAGAVTGIYGYRRVSAAGRRLSGLLSDASLPRRASRGHRGALGVARETLRFARDVREGMELYMDRHSAPAPPSLAGGDPGPARGPGTSHDIRPRDGH